MTLTAEILKSSINRQVITLGLAMGFLAGVFPGPAAVALTMALFTGNQRTAFRQRDMLNPFYFIPISVGLASLSGWLAFKLLGRDNRQQTLGD